MSFIFQLPFPHYPTMLPSSLWPWEPIWSEWYFRDSRVAHSCPCWKVSLVHQLHAGAGLGVVSCRSLCQQASWLSITNFMGFPTRRWWEGVSSRLSLLSPWAALKRWAAQCSGSDVSSPVLSCSLLTYWLERELLMCLFCLICLCCR